MSNFELNKVADKITDKLENELKKSEYASLIVCGGNSVKLLLNELSKKKISWENVSVSLVDERLVPNGHKDSNQLFVKKNLLINSASNAQFVPLTKNFKQNKLIRRPYTITVLSLADDGHFASIFPTCLNAKHLINPEASPEIVLIPPVGKPKHARLTMNLAMILESDLLILLVNGQQKRKIFDEAASNTKLPIYWLLSQKKKNLYVSFGDK